MVEDKSALFRDLADSLRLEVSDIPPGKEKYIKEFAVKVKGVIEEKYGKYFGPDTIEIVKGLEDRIISFSPGAFVRYHNIVDPDLGEEAAKGAMGAYLSEEWGCVITIESRKTLMKREGFAEAVANTLLHTTLTKKQARNIIKSMFFKTIAVHEIAHAYEAMGLPTYFSECAAPYYDIAIHREMPGMGMIDSDGKMGADFYKKLVANFGEEVHGLFFGSNRDGEFAEKVFTAFTPEVLKELFPEGYGAVKDFQTEK